MSLGPESGGEQYFPPEQTQTETTTETVVEFAELVTRDEYIRLECLRMATETIPLNRTGNEQQFIVRARYFEQYIKNGAFEGETTNG